jgi:hypothetical protein
MREILYFVHETKNNVLAVVIVGFVDVQQQYQQQDLNI